MVTANDIRKKLNIGLKTITRDDNVESIKLSSNIEEGLLYVTFNKLLVFPGIDAEGQYVDKPDYGMFAQYAADKTYEMMPEGLAVTVSVNPTRGLTGVYKSRDILRDVNGVNDLHTQRTKVKISFAGQLTNLDEATLYRIVNKIALTNLDAEGKEYPFTIADNTKKGLFGNKASLGAKQADVLLDRPKKPAVGFGPISAIIQAFAKIINVLAKPFRRGKADPLLPVGKTTVFDKEAAAEKEAAKQQKLSEKKQLSEAKKHEKSASREKKSLAKGLTERLHLNSIRQSSKDPKQLRLKEKRDGYQAKLAAERQEADKQKDVSIGAF